MLAVLPLLLDSGWRIKIAFPNQASVGDHQTLADRISGLDVRPISLATHLPTGQESLSRSTAAISLR